MRMFIALPLPEAVKEDLAGFLEPRQEAGLHGLRWTMPAQWHVTLAFLPDLVDRHTDELFERLRRATVRRNPLVLRLVGAGAFPHAARANQSQYQRVSSQRGAPEAFEQLVRMPVNQVRQEG